MWPSLAMAYRNLAVLLLLSGCALLNSEDVMTCITSCDECKKVVMECTSTEGNKIDAEQIIKKRKIL